MPETALEILRFTEVRVFVAGRREGDEGSTVQN